MIELCAVDGLYTCLDECMPFRLHSYTILFHSVPFIPSHLPIGVRMQEKGPKLSPSPNAKPKRETQTVIHEI